MTCISLTQDLVASAHHKEVIEARKAVGLFLLKHRFDPGDVNSRPTGWLSRCGWATYPLHEAVKQNDAYITSALLMFGANMETKDSWGHTACHYAEGEKQAEVRKVLQHHSKYCLSPHAPCLCGHPCQYCPPPRGFEEFFAHLEMDPLVQVPSSEAQWLLFRGPKALRAHQLPNGSLAHKACGSVADAKLASIIQHSKCDLVQL